MKLKPLTAAEKWLRHLLVPSMAGIALLFAAPVSAQVYEDDYYDTGVDWDLDELGTEGEYEYEFDEGLHEEEWYDPSDWFDASPGVDYERDWWNYGYYDTYGDYGYYDEGVYDGYDYYTEDWWNEENEFDEWWE